VYSVPRVATDEVDGSSGEGEFFLIKLRSGTAGHAPGTEASGGRAVARQSSRIGVAS
jgi:hypothetical protein